jgi:hypothetical protein
MSSSTVFYDTANKHNTECIFNVPAMLFYSTHKNTALQKLNSCQIYYSTVHNTKTVTATLHVTELCYSVNVNSLTPELNPSEQRCLPEFFTGAFKF